jgi:putative tryptophan/tyrosine transport system substrate-binding protein
MLRRRHFIAGLAGAAAMPLMARAQQRPSLPVIGFLNSASSDTLAAAVAAFHQGLRQTGYVEGQNVTIQYRYADGQYEKLAGMVADLISRQVSVIMAGGPPAAQVAQAATSGVPIVFTSGVDAVKLGLVASLSRPGGNVTGISFLNDDLGAKRIGLLRTLLPKARTIALLVNPNFLDAGQLRDAQEAARIAGMRSYVFNASDRDEIDVAFSRMAELRVDALLVNADPFLSSRRQQMAILAARHAVPTMYNFRESVVAGGLMSYDTSLSEAYREAGVYVGRILHGDKPSDLPVLRPTKFEFLINLRTAKALGLTVPPQLLAIADEVID